MGKIDRPLSPRKIYENKESYNNGNVISVEYKKIRLNIIADIDIRTIHGIIHFKILYRVKKNYSTQL